MLKTNLLGNSNFRYLWGSQILSQVTINIMTFLVLIRIFELTGSTIAASFVWVVNALPAIIVGPVGAVASDLYDRKKILVITNAAQALIMLFYALTYEKVLYLSYGVVLGYSLFNQFYTPAEASSLTAIVKKEKLTQANSIFFLSKQVAVLTSLALAGLAGEIFGFGTTVFLGFLFLFLALVSVLKLPKLTVENNEKITSFEDLTLQFFVKIIEGYKLIRQKKEIFFPFVFLMFLQICVTILFINLPEIGTAIIHTKPSFVGVLAILPAGIGALLGTYIVSKLLSRNWRKKHLIQISLNVLGFGLIIIPLMVPVLGFWAGRTIVIICFAAAGIAYVNALIPATTYLQENTPAEFMGRVFGNFWFITSIISVLPVLFAATITEILGVRALMVILGLASLSMFGILKYYLARVFENGV